MKTAAFGTASAGGTLKMFKDDGRFRTKVKKIVRVLRTNKKWGGGGGKGGETRGVHGEWPPKG